MERIADLSSAEEQIFQKVKRLISVAGSIVAREPPSLEVGVATLERLREEIYEDLNQIQHEAMIVRAARTLQVSDLAGVVEWWWNPRQTGAMDEPDLRGIVAGRIVISAEITTSARPVGTIGQRMGTTLTKLSRMPGKRVYFVRTELMEERARTKVNTAGHDIEVRRI